jgi:hypothetical protein
MEIGNLQREYQKMINAQGTNPWAFFFIHQLFLDSY